MNHRADGATLSFTTPPPAALQPTLVQLGIIGDLGQTQDSHNTVNHLLASNISSILHAGDLSYADCDQPRWDTYAQLVDPLASRIPWMTVAGNHEEEGTDRCGASMNRSFAAYNARYGSLMPHAEAGSRSTQYYSFETAGVHVVMLGSYIDYEGDGANATQIAWLKADLAKLDRRRTPWLVGVLHAPWCTRQPRSPPVGIQPVGTTHSLACLMRPLIRARLARRRRQLERCTPARARGD